MLRVDCALVLHNLLVEEMASTLEMLLSTDKDSG